MHLLLSRMKKVCLFHISLDIMPAPDINPDCSGAASPTLPRIVVGTAWLRWLSGGLLATRRYPSVWAKQGFPALPVRRVCSSLTAEPFISVGDNVVGPRTAVSRRL